MKNLICFLIFAVCIAPSFPSEKSIDALIIEAEQGNAGAQFDLGFAYATGQGVEQDYTEAVEWYRKAAEQGHSGAQFNLAMIYIRGNGIARNYAEAAKWFQSASDQDNTSAQCMLGSLYAEGLGVSKDYIQAYKWLTLSITGSLGNQVPFLEKAKDMSTSLAEKMTSQQVEEAQELAEQWVDGYLNRTDYRVLSFMSAFKEPVLSGKINPPYTEKASRARAGGVVVLECVILKDGTVNDCMVIRSVGYGLDESAIHTVTNEWRFKPGTYRGKPVDCLLNVEVLFKK